jgi:hypothetical protein
LRRMTSAQSLGTAEAAEYKCGIMGTT